MTSAATACIWRRSTHVATQSSDAEGSGAAAPASREGPGASGSSTGTSGAAGAGAFGVTGAGSLPWHPMLATTT